MKKILNSSDLIDHLKSKGIQFNIINETDACTFLTESNYYLKLGSYRANYEKGPNGLYKSLDFAYLIELSKLDMYLRYQIIKMCLDIEHSLKVTLLNKLENIPDEDGYDLSRKYIKNYEKTLKDITAHSSSSYCKNLIDKYYPYFPVWVLVEVISFGSLLRLCWFYGEEYNDPIIDSKLMNSVRDLRNAAAHSNCAINRLKSNDNSPLPEITNYVSTIPGIGKSSRKKKLKNKFLYDFTVLIYVYNIIVKSKKLKHTRLTELSELLNVRFKQHIDYFKCNNLITTSFDYMKKIVDNSL